MYLESIHIQNFGSLKNITIDCPFDDENMPLPIILVGTNGSGKTSVLANIVDAFIELKRKKYSSLQEVKNKNYFKVGKKTHISSGENYSHVNIKIMHNGKIAKYIDFSCNVSQDELNKSIDINNFPDINWQNKKLISEGYFKTVIADDDFLQTFENNILLYFPFSRYETPAWWNPEHEMGFKITEKYVGASERNFIKNNVIKETEEWLLNVFLDAELYEKQLTKLGQIKDSTGNTESFNGMENLDVLLGYFGKNTSLRQEINKLLTTLYKARDPNIEKVRLGVSDKSYRRIAVISKLNELPEVEIAPTLSHLSSGESMIFSLFCSILREYDQLQSDNIINLASISGTVIIDEIDLHLHIDLQKKLLPQLIKEFPKIQFIITSHSPLFLLGIEESFENIKAINLPYGNLIPLSDFSEVEYALNLFNEKYSSFKKSYQAASKAIQDLTTPLIITEGKTDWKHIKKALERLQLENEYNDANFVFLEYEDELNMGDSELMVLCEQFKKTPQPRKIICIFDRDNPRITSSITDPYIDFGNNVYAFCISKPSHRVDYNNISIEFLYTDNEICTIDENGKRLLFSNEVEKRITQAMSKKNSTMTFIKLDTPLEEDEFNKKIYDQDVDKVIDSKGISIGLSKSVFAQYVSEDKDGYSEFNLDAFRAIFDTILQIIR